MHWNRHGSSAAMRCKSSRPARGCGSAGRRRFPKSLRRHFGRAGLRNLPVEECLDTAHVFAAGYDIKTESGLASTIGQIESTIGLENVPVFHVNDSKIDLGGRVDRHEHIGKGMIGAEAFARILRHPRFGTTAPEGLTGRAFVAETPVDDPGGEPRNVAVLGEVAGLEEPAPRAEKGFSMLTAALQKKNSIHRKAKQKRKDNAETQRTPRLAEKNARTGKSVSTKSKPKKKRG